MNNTLTEPTAVGKLCETEVRRSLLTFFLGQRRNETDESLRPIELTDEIGVDQSAIHDNITPFIDVGIVAKERDRTYKTDRQSSVVQALLELEESLAATTNQTVDGLHLTTLYGSDSLYSLTDYFVKWGVEYDEYQPLSKSKIHENVDVSRKSIIKNIDVPVEYEIIVVDEQKGFPRYKPASDSDSFREIVETNLTLIRNQK